jgi:hypothetical protein
MTRVVVAAIRAREPFVMYLQKHIPDLEIVWDEKRDSMDTFLRSTALVGDDPAIHLEDDICLTKDWREKIEAEIALRPNDVINFFSRSKYDEGLGSHYKAGARFLYNVCYYTPAGFSRQIIEHYPGWQERFPTYLNFYDTLMADLMIQQKRNYWQVVPSLVNHAQIKSQIGKRSSRRQSKTFINPELEGYPDESRFL